MEVEGRRSLIDRIYEAAGDARLWTMVLGTLAEVFRARSALLLGIDDESAGVRVHHASGVTAGQISEYEAHWAQADPRVAYARSHPGARVLFDDLHTSARERDVDPFYHWLRSHDTGCYLGARLADSGKRMVFLCVQWGPEQGHARAHDIHRFEALRIHFSRAIELGERLRAAHTNHEMSLGLSGHLRVGVMILDGRRDIVQTNETASVYIAAADALRIDDDRLHAIRQGDDKRLQQHIVAALESDDGGATRPTAILALARRYDPSPCVLTIWRLQRPAGITDPGDRRLMILLQVPLQPGAIQAMPLQALFGLSRREAEVAALVASGARLPDIATALNISKRTVKVHLQSTFAKTGTHRQAELVALVLASGAGNGLIGAFDPVLSQYPG